MGRRYRGPYAEEVNAAHKFQIVSVQSDGNETMGFDPDASGYRSSCTCGWRSDGIARGARDDEANWAEWRMLHLLDMVNQAELANTLHD